MVHSAIRREEEKPMDGREMLAEIGCAEQMSQVSGRGYQLIQEEECRAHLTTPYI
jgi:hypothetical protein